MRPSYLDNISWRMAEVYASVTDRILINLAKYFPFIKVPEQMQSAIQFVSDKLSQFGSMVGETISIIANGLSGADEALHNVMEQTVKETLKTEEPKYQKAVQQGYLPNYGTPSMQPKNMKAFQESYQETALKLNHVNTVMLESTEDAYRATVSDIAARIARTQEILDTESTDVITGVKTWNKAMQDAVKRMVDNGLTGFVDHGGHKWSPEAYASMVIRTEMWKASREAVWERAEQYGNDIYQVSSHNAARPLCYPWQSKLVSRIDFVRDVKDLDGNIVHVYAQSETTYGEPAGLFGINCKHYPMTFIPGFSSLKGEPQSEEENAKAYAESQQQRALERKLREEKRDLEVLKAQGAGKAELQAQRQRIHDASSDIAIFCEQTGRTRDRSRETAPVVATWPDDELGTVQRFGGEYIEAP